MVLVLAAWLVPRHIAGARRRRSRSVLLLDVAPFALGAGAAGARDRPAAIRRADRARRSAPGSRWPTTRCARPCASRWCFPNWSSCRRSSPIRISICRSPGRGWCSAALRRRSRWRWRCWLFEPPLWAPQPLAALAAAGAGCRRRLAARARAAARRRGGRAAPARGRAASRSRTPPRSGRSRCCSRIPSIARRRAARARDSWRSGRAGVSPRRGARHDGRRTRSRSSSCSANCFSTRAGCRRRSRASCWPGSTPAARLGAVRPPHVPGWGANTMRTEFAVLTGIPESALGYDRFNPYYALARVPIESQVWRLRRAGYRTICLHPFDRRFFRRDLAMPALGFERFLGRETLGGRATRRPISPTPSWPATSCGSLDAEGPRTFIFAITMGNHGPWLAKGPPIDPAVAGAVRPGGDAGRGRAAALSRRAAPLRRDAADLLDGLERRGRPAVLGFYGDHLPSLPQRLRAFRLRRGIERLRGLVARTARRSGGTSQSHELGRIIVDGVLGADRSRRRRPRVALASRQAGARKLRRDERFRPALPGAPARAAAAARDDRRGAPQLPRGFRGQVLRVPVLLDPRC